MSKPQSLIRIGFARKSFLYSFRITAVCSILCAFYGSAKLENFKCKIFSISPDLIPPEERPIPYSVKGGTCYVSVGEKRILDQYSLYWNLGLLLAVCFSLVGYSDRVVQLFKK
jgi:hypothetical protein